MRAPSTALLLLLCLSCTTLASSQTQFLTGFRLIDGSGAAALEDAAMVVAESRIRAIGPSAEVSAPDGAQTIDLTGKTVVPGIINLHGHVGNTRGLRQDRSFFTRDNVIRTLETYARYGVVLTTSMGTDEDVMIEFRDERNRGVFGGARVMTALQGFTARAGYPTKAPGVKGVAQEVATAAQARARVDRLAEKGADLVKMWVDSHHGEYEKLDPAIYEAIIEQARKRKLLSFAHVYELEDAKRLVRAGVDILGHSVRDREVDQPLIDLLTENDVYYVPTLTREQSTFVYHDPPAWLDDPFFTQSVDEQTIEGLRTTMREAQSDPKVIEQGRSDFETASKNARKLIDAGVAVAFGTDTGPAGRFPGYFEHWEAQLMVEAGFTPMQVIESWSKTASKALRVEDDFGTLEKGKFANLIVLDANPLDDIRNTRKIHRVYLEGKAVE